MPEQSLIVPKAPPHPDAPDGFEIAGPDAMAGSLSISSHPPPGSPDTEAQREQAAQEAAHAAALSVRTRFLTTARPVTWAVAAPVAITVLALEAAGNRWGWALGLWIVGTLFLLGAATPSIPKSDEGTTWRGHVYLLGLVALGLGALGQFGPSMCAAVTLVTAAWTAACFGGSARVWEVTGLTALGALGLIVATPPPAIDAMSWGVSLVSLAAGMLLVGYMNCFVLRGLDRAVHGLTSSLERERSERKEREKAQEELANARRVEALGRLAAGIAHDMNNSLMVVLGNVSVLRDRLDRDDEDHQLLEDVTEAAQGARDIVRQLLVMASQETKSPGVCNVEQVLSRLRKPLERLLPENIDVVMHRHAEAWVPLGRAELERILLNLALNARDAMEQGGVLTIDARARENYVVIRVSDTGTGMSNETQARIFDPFFTTKGVDRGTGLGLATVKGLVKGAFGSISVRSELHHGSVFRVAFPRVHPPEEQQQPIRQKAAAPSRVLVVEDDPGVRSSLVRMLRADGHLTLEAGNARDAATVLDHAEDLDLLLTDAVMPDSDVPELIQHFHRRFPDQPVIICSGWVQEELVRQGIATGNYLFLEKPFTQDTLRAVMGQALGAPKHEASQAETVQQHAG